MRESKRASIKDVAQLAGVSLGTASRAINNSGSVSLEARSRVERAVKMLGYTPNHAAQSLRRGSTSMLGYMFPDVGNALYNRLYRRLEHEFYARGYMSVLSNSASDVSREVATINRFQERGVDAMIIAPSHERDPRLIQAINDCAAPVIILDRDIEVARDKIFFDHAVAIRACVDSLTARGHSRIGFVTWESTSRPVRRREEAFRSATKAHGFACSDLIAKVALSTSSAYDVMVKMIQSPNPPTAIIAHGTSIVVSSLRAIEDQGMTVPDDIDVFSIGRNDFITMYRPDLPFVQLDFESLLSSLHTTVARRIDNPNLEEPKSTLIGFTLEGGEA